MLYERDYKFLTETERNKMDKLDTWFKDMQSKYNGIRADRLIKYWDNMPLAAIFYKSLFPNNNFVNECYDLKNTKRILKEFEEYNREIQKYSFLN